MATVTLSGQLLAGPGGVLRAPLSGQRCVWWTINAARSCRAQPLLLRTGGQTVWLDHHAMVVVAAQEYDDGWQVEHRLAPDAHVTVTGTPDGARRLLRPRVQLI